MCTCEICVLLAALLEPLCMYLVNLSIKDASRHDAEPHIVRTSSARSGQRRTERRVTTDVSPPARGLAPRARRSARGAAARPSPRTPGLTGTALG